MKKLYTTPTVEYIRVSAADVITASDTGGTKLPPVPLPGEDEIIP